MKIDLTDVSSVKKTMVVEIPPEEIQRETQAVLRGYAGKAKIPGFRQGKVPTDILRKRFGKEIKEDVRDRVLQRYYHKATLEKGLTPIGQPVVDEIHLDDAPFSFKTTFEVLPELEPKNYKEVEVRRPAVEVDDGEVAKALEDLRQARVQLITEEGRKAQTGDVISADVKGEPEDGEAFERERMLIEVGATDNLPAFNEGLEGVEAGGQPTFSVEYPEDYGSEGLAGKTVRYTLNVHEVKRRETPELDDEFAKDLGDFGGLDELKAKIREDLLQRKEHEADRGVRQSILEKVLTDNPVVLPEVLVEDEIRSRLEGFVRNMYQQGMDPEQMELDWKDIRERQDEPARKTVHAQRCYTSVSPSTEAWKLLSINYLERNPLT
jgi:trigger factor